MTMFIHFFCLCPLGLTTCVKLNFNILRVAYLLVWSDYMCTLQFLIKLKEHHAHTVSTCSYEFVNAGLLLQVYVPC